MTVVASWVDSGTPLPAAEPAALDRVDWPRVWPYMVMHLLCLTVFVVGVSPVALVVAALLYVVRMFALTAFYHRYFSHRAFRTSRAWQFVFALLGASALQHGPIWWAAHHRHHHVHSDQEDDAHSPAYRGFFWSHMGWFMSRRHFAPDLTRVQDLQRYPELRALDRFEILVPIALGVALFVLGDVLEREAPGLATSGWQMVIWGAFISTLVCHHAAYSVSSLCHRFGTRRYETSDNSRNNVWLALPTLGEGWHNNHHYYPAAARTGFFWWEIDPTYCGLRVLEWLGIIWDLKPVPAHVRDARQERSAIDAE